MLHQNCVRADLTAIDSCAFRSRFADAWLERSRVAPMTYVGCLPAKDAATSFLIFSPSPLCR